MWKKTSHELPDTAIKVLTWTIGDQPAIARYCVNIDEWFYEDSDYELDPIYWQHIFPPGVTVHK